METVAWTTQKCEMHRFLWCPHKSLHEPRKGAFELNDLSGLFFGAISIALIAWNAEAGGPLWALSVGLGMAAYGAVYFLAHEHSRTQPRPMAHSGPERLPRAALSAAPAVPRRERKGCVSFGFVFARIARAPEKGAARRNQTLKKSQPHSKRRTIDGTKPRGLL